MINAQKIRLLALVAIALTAINMRAAVTALSPLVPRIQNDLGIGGTTVGILGTIPTAMFALSALLTPKMIRHMSGPRTLFAAMLLSAAAQILRVMGPSTALLLTGSLLALFAVGVTNAAIPLAVRAYFPDAVPRISMVYIVAMQIGMLTTPLLAEPIASIFTQDGWRWSLATWSLFALAAALAWAPLLGNPLQKAHKDVGNLALVEGPRVPVWKTKIGWGLAIMFGFTSFASYAMMMFIPQFFTTAGASVQFGALMLAVWSGLGLLLGIIAPWAVGRFKDPYPVVIVFLLLFLIGNTGMALAPLAAPWLWVICSSLGPLPFPMALTLVNIRARSMDGATALSSFGQGMGYILACGGPFLMGFLRETTGGWFWPNIVITIALILIAAGSWFVTRDEFVEDQLLPQQSGRG